MEVTVKIPAAKPDDVLAKRLDAAFARIERTLKGGASPAVDMAPMTSCLRRMESQQGKMLGVLKEIRSGIQDADSLDELQDTLESQWKKLQRSLQGLADPTVETRLPSRFYTALDKLEDALTKPQTMRMSPAMGKKLDELKEAIARSRPKTFGMMR